MEFIVIGRDGTDAEAPARRAAVRSQHLAKGDQLKADGRLIFGVAILNEAEQMVGSVYVMTFPSRAELDAYLKEEPYVVGDVWRDIQIEPGRVGPAFQSLIR